MLKHLKISLLFWSTAGFILVEVAIIKSRLALEPWVCWKLFIGTLILYNILGLLISFISFAAERLVFSHKSEKEKSFLPWLFGGIHGGIALFLSSFFYLNKIILPDNYIFSFSGIAANLGLMAGSVVIGALIVMGISKLLRISWKWAPIAIVAGFVVINYAMYFKAQSIQNRPSEVQRLERRDNGLKVFLFGVDGATWDVLDPLIKNGEVPNFARLVETGFSDRFRTIFPTSSPVIWTSIATGKKASKHGVVNVVFTVVPGLNNAVIHFPQFLGAKLCSDLLVKMNVFNSVPASSTIRQTKALWNINSDYNLTTEVVGWWGTWPPDSINGSMVSDHASKRKQEIRVAKGQLNVEDNFGYEAIPKNYPLELGEELAEFNLAAQELTLEEANYYVDADSALLKKINSGNRWDRFDFTTAIKFSYLTDKFYFLSGKYLMKEEDWDCFMLYLNQVDVMEHYFWAYYDYEHMKRKHFGDLPFEDVIPKTYKVMDTMLGEIIQRLDENTVLIVVSDHGFETWYLPTGYPIADHRHAPDGIIIAAGPHIRHKKQRVGEYSVYDITPTILNILGIPLSKDMDGKIMENIFEPGFPAQNPPIYVDSHDHGFKWRSRATQSVLDKEALDKFKALGYIK